MKTIEIKSKPVLNFKDIPLPDFGHGFSVYRDVLIFWDEDYDNRIITLIDSLPEAVRNILVAIREHEGSLQVVWSTKCDDAEYLDEGVTVHNDWWNMNEAHYLTNNTPPIAEEGSVNYTRSL